MQKRDSVILVQAMARRRMGAEPLPEPMMNQTEYKSQSGNAARKSNIQLFGKNTQEVLVRYWFESTKLNKAD